MSPQPFSLRLSVIVLWTLAFTAVPQISVAATCPQDTEARIWTTPQRPTPGEPLEILAVSTGGALDEVLVTDPKGRTGSLRSKEGGGPPWSLSSTLFRPFDGTYRFEATRDGRVVACREVEVGGRPNEQGTGDWDLATEAFYAAWIEHLFDAPPEQSLSYPSLAPVLRDPERNMLFDYFGAGEDRNLPAEPDCADLPYFLRTYFAWKLELPIAYRACNRGSRTSPPRCEGVTVETRFGGSPAPLGTFRDVSRRLMDTVHSGSGRTALQDNETDFYPVALERESLWPGTIYADPYGHVMVLVQWLPGKGGESGLLLAVDAQPDNSVTRKRFWEGTFLFADTPSAGPGFKAFRPLAGSGGSTRPVSNRALDGRSGVPACSLAQASLSADAFYAHMERLINPQGLDPRTAYESTLAALMEQLETRITSVDNGEQYMRARPGAVISMPSGPAIFETTGPWEDYATPSRDMRLLIAMNVLAGLPERIRRHPDLYRLGGENPDAAARRIEQLHEQRLDDRSISYRRSDGSAWPLTLRDIYARRAGLEVAYNPNDCIERRWGASSDTEDEATCRRRAPRDQQARMEDYRTWFRETTRPPR